jgi:cysteinyl-tRNA synthetase
MFPHHENEIAQSESATGKTLAYHWMHVRFCWWTGARCRSPKATSSLCATCCSRVTRHRDPLSAHLGSLSASPELHHGGLTNRPARWIGCAPSPADSRRWLAGRAQCGAGSPDSEGAAELLCGAGRRPEYLGGRAAIFDLVRAGNVAADSGKLYAGNVTPLRRRCGASTRSLPSSTIAMRRLPVARCNGRRRKGEATRRRPNLWPRIRLATNRSTPCWRSGSRLAAARNFARSDSIRKELAALGILIEDSKDGARWKRK